MLETVVGFASGFAICMILMGTFMYMAAHKIAEEEKEDDIAELMEWVYDGAERILSAAEDIALEIGDDDNDIAESVYVIMDEAEDMIGKWKKKTGGDR